MATANNDFFMYFHCDEWKSYQSMNPCYDNILYRNRTGRRALWKRIKKDIEDGVITVNKNDVPAVRTNILEGDPTKANDFICYGNIIRLEVAD